MDDARDGGTPAPFLRFDSPGAIDNCSSDQHNDALIETLMTDHQKDEKLKRFDHSCLLTSNKILFLRTVGDVRIGTVENTGMGKHSTGKKMTWADIARMPPGIVATKGTHKYTMAKTDKGVDRSRVCSATTSSRRPAGVGFDRSFYRNNPVDKCKV